MKKKKDRSMLYAAMVGFVLVGLPVLTLLATAVWSMNAPPSLGDRLPPGTQILQNTDTHRGFFRHQGVATLVARIPPEHIQAFGETLREEEDFLEGPIYDHIREAMENVDGIEDALDSEHTLIEYRDRAIAFVEEPFSDWLAAIYDLETGLFCYVEYDN